MVTHLQMMITHLPVSQHENLDWLSEFRIWFRDLITIIKHETVVHIDHALGDFNETLSIFT